MKLENYFVILISLCLYLYRMHKKVERLIQREIIFKSADPQSTLVKNADNFPRPLYH